MIGSLFVATEQDLKQARELERRRRVESERKARIFNPKTRIIGVDKQALDNQLLEKKMIKDNEMRLNDAFHAQMEKNRLMAQELAIQEKIARNKAFEELNNFRQTFQRKHDRREYDIYDADFLKKQQPVRKEDHEDIPISSAQKFEGEDLMSEERRRLMEEQRVSWLKQQIEEKKAQKDLEKMSDETLSKILFAREQRALQLELAERKCKQLLEAANNKYNSILAAERNNKKYIEKEEEIQDNQAEIYNHLTSDLMLENPNAAKSVYGPHRSINYMYKGMSQEEKEYYRKQQLDQIAERKAKLELSKQTDAQWNELCEIINTKADIFSTERMTQQREQSAKVKRDNYLLSLEQKEKQKIMNKILTTNQPTEDFFNKFGTTTR